MCDIRSCQVATPMHLRSSIRLRKSSQRCQRGGSGPYDSTDHPSSVLKCSSAAARFPVGAKARVFLILGHYEWFFVHFFIVLGQPSVISGTYNQEATNDKDGSNGFQHATANTPCSGIPETRGDGQRRSYLQVGVTDAISASR